MPGRWGDSLSGKLVQVSIEDEDGYEAISYTWGAQPPVVVIEVDSSLVAIGPNLALLLRRLRHEVQPRRLWVDTLCINQGDNDEKQAEMRRMDDIYRKASCTTIWLGEEDLATAPAFELLRDLDQIMDQHWNEVAWWPTREQLQARGLPVPEDPKWTALSSFLNNQWFLRTWILQEAALSQNPWIRQGPHTFDWKKFVRIVLCLCDSTGVNNSHNVNLTLANHVCKICARAEDFCHDPKLLDLMWLSRNSSATNDEDKVFALIGLAGDIDDVRSLIDLKHQAREVYVKLALHYLSQGDLRALALAGDSTFGNVRGLPSWAADWTGWTGYQPWTITLPYIRLEPCMFAWERKMETLPEISQDQTKVTLQGQIVDSIAHVGTHIPFVWRRDREDALPHLECWRRLAHRLSNEGKYTAEKQIDEAFAGLLALDAKRHLLGGSSYSEVYSRYITQYKSGRSVAATSHDDDQNAIVAEFRNLVGMHCTGRTFFTTSGGRMGLGPYFLRPGDRVAWFDGGSVPFAVRRAKKHYYKNVGDLYLAGTLHAEHHFAGTYEDICLI